MKLSDIVAQLNLLDSLDVAGECSTAVSKLNHITHIVTEHANQDQTASQNISKTFDDLSSTITKFSAQVENLKQNIRREYKKYKLKSRK